MTTLYGWGPMFDAPSPSPFVMKADMQMQMLGVSFDRAIADLESVKKHKAPYVDDGGWIVEDSTFIRQHFEEKLGVELDAGLTNAQRGAAWALERALEDHLTPIVVSERWVEDDNFNRGPAAFFMAVPQAIRADVIAQARNSVRAGLHQQGFGRHTRKERMQLAARDVGAVASILGDKPFLFGDAPTAADAVAFGVLASAAARFFDSELPDIVHAHATLSPYLARIEGRFFADAKWPTMV